MIRPCRTFLSAPCRNRVLRHYHNSSKERVVVALSGGVDSSVALGLLQSANNANSNQHASLSAIYMSNWNLYDDDSVQCTIEVDWKDAQAVAQHFHCPIHRVALEAEYWTCVFEPFLDGLSSSSSKQQMGNPDIACNTYIKFGALLENVKKRYGPDTVLATGHYARLWNPHREPPPFLQAIFENDSTGLMNWIREDSMQSNASILLAAADSTKDQSYFLSGCSGQALRDVRFPLGDLYKKTMPDPNQNVPTVRQLASAWNIPVANKRDSTGICFVGKRRSFRDFLLQNQYLPRAEAPVDFIDVDTQQLVGTTAPKNTHPVLFTPGQGARISGSPTKYFVTGVLKAADGLNHHHRVGVCAGTHHPALYADALFIQNINWIAGGPPPRLMNGQHWRLKCRIRHLQPLQDCTLSCNGSGLYKLSFDLPLRGITSGQQAVLYDPSGMVCLGGGAIFDRGPSFFEMGLPMPHEVAPAGHNDHSTTRRLQTIQN